MEHTPEYAAYLERVEQRFGGKTLGGYGKWRGRLVKVLAPTEFAGRYREYRHLEQAYEQIMASGDTVNDAIVQLLNEHAADLLLDPDY